MSNSTLKISARNAGQVALEKYCPRCCWYLLRLKHWPFQFGMPGIMFYLEQAQKAYIFKYLKKFRKLPESFGSFSDCTEPVDFPFSMEAFHEESGVLVTARADMMLRMPSGNICLLDLKTSKVEGGGKMFLPQYQIQTIGYSWVTEAAGVGKVEKAGLIYCQIQHEIFKQDPLDFSDESIILMPFEFIGHEVDLDYERFTECLKEMNRLWNEPSPPRGADNCKDCALLSRVIDFETSLRAEDSYQALSSSGMRDVIYTRQYDRVLARGNDALQRSLDWETSRDELGDGLWDHWDFSS